ncbi:ATP-dependent RNA helicase A [Paragonimus westermani]|uniref:RNA helicase n=1 Tax=Paragonimus westermani TaxID=34504 RepID=A0A5J4NLI8_9TREM|nr:ATP-dependent RNA helicase A [Paragonimus westermani]
MGDTEGIKSWLYSYLQTSKRIAPEYTIMQKPAGRGRFRFVCELRVESFGYIGIGNSTSKKDAQTNAARDFANYLVREGHVKASDVPSLKPGETGVPESSNSTVVPMFQSQFLSSAPRSTLPVTPQPAPTYINRIFDQKKLEEAEEVDLTADIHGGWSMENAKARLNEYLQTTRQQIGEVKYTALGPDHNRSYAAEMTIFAKGLRKNLYSRESGSNKQMASRACCLSLVRQLFHAGEIGAFTGEKKKKKHDEVPPYTVNLSASLEQSLASLLDDLGLQPSVQPPRNLTPDQPFNMITHYNLTDFEEVPAQQPQLIPWCPPMPNWNPWFGCNIDDGPQASMSLSEISAILAEERLRHLDNEPNFRSLLEDRAQLPVHPYRRSIMDTITHNRVTLIRGETGCGKTTQVPQFILDSFIESGRGAECSILVTQPRRISAISLAERIAFERAEVVGTSVGYSVRFETVHPRPYGSILFCTVGTMARKMESGLRGVSHIIVDEIHERDVNTDFMLILLREMVQAHRDLRLVLMSATIDTTMFVEYFGECSVLDIEGRTHPVEYYFLEDCIKMLNYVPPPCDERKRKRRLEAEMSAEAVADNCNLVCGSEYGEDVARSMREITEKEAPFDLIGCLLERIAGMGIPGAVLIFLPGWNIISMLRKYLQAHPRFGGKDYLILPLHSQVPREDQRLVFRPSPPGVTKLVLSTNIAETSITINDVVFVIDLCLVRMKMFTARNNMTSYSTSWASKTNLEQRRGRAGRVRPGYAFHLCSRARYDRLEQHSTPEILRTPLHELALMIKLLRLGSVGDFLMKAMQPPPLDAVIEAEHTLKEMKALDKNDELTPLGSILARLPIEPRLGKMMIFACVFNLGCSAAILACASSLGCEPFLMPPDRRRLSNDQRRFAAGYSSDHLASLNIFQVWSAERTRRGEQAADYLCERHELNAPALRMMEDAGNQIRTILINLSFPEERISDSGIDFNSQDNVDCDMLCSLLTLGLYPNICFHVEKRKLLTVEGTVALAHKGSVNCSNVAIKFDHPFFVFDEKIRTQAVSCKGLTMVNPLQLMLFGCRTATWTEGDSNTPGVGTVLLDDWLPLRMNFSTAARVFALRPALEALLVRACLRPEQLSEPEEADQRVIEMVRNLCARHPVNDLSRHQLKQSESDSPPRKKFASSIHHPLLSGRSRRMNEMEDRGFERYVNHPEQSFDRGSYFNRQRGFPGMRAPGAFNGAALPYRPPIQQDNYGQSWSPRGTLPQNEELPERFNYPMNRQRFDAHPPWRGGAHPRYGGAY